jgi:hypothetical protein
VEPIPRNAFPNVIDKVLTSPFCLELPQTGENYCQGLVSETEARELYATCVSLLGSVGPKQLTILSHRFFSGCQIFIPLFDPTYDTFDSLKSRTPFCFDSILAVASKIRAGNRPPSETFHRCLEEAQGIARSTLFGPIVRKEAVQGTYPSPYEDRALAILLMLDFIAFPRFLAMLLLSAWSTNGWLPSGHAMRMALDLGLHRALEKLAETSNSSVAGSHGPMTPETASASGKRRSDDEERHLGASFVVLQLL